jgi:DNA-binding NarL/FixJ family response regulator
VAIVEDDRRTCDCLTTPITSPPDIFANGRSFLWKMPWSVIGTKRPTSPWWISGCPGCRGIDGLARLRQKYPTVALVMLTVFEDDERISQALCAGAIGYLFNSKKTPPAKLLERIGEVLRRGAPMSPEVVRRRKWGTI